MSREEIINKMLTAIPEEYDKSEGSFFYDNLMAVAIELEEAYKEQQDILDKGFADTASGEWMDKLVSMQGLERKQATKATGQVKITGNVGAVIHVGDRVSSDTLEYTATEEVTVGVEGYASVTVECEIAGTSGNVPLGAIKSFPVTLDGLNDVFNETPISGGYDVETDESLRNRYYDKVRTPATSGNKHHYRNWALSVTGVGDARVIPLWNGAGTVKVVIINSEKTGASDTLVNDAAAYIEEYRPIGADVTVVSANEVPINITVTLTIDTVNTTEAEVQGKLEEDIRTYLKSNAFVKDYVSYAQIGSIILDTEGVLDYTNLTINGGTANLSISSEEVAILGAITLE